MSPCNLKKSVAASENIMEATIECVVNENHCRANSLRELFGEYSLQLVLQSQPILMMTKLMKLEKRFQRFLNH